MNGAAIDRRSTLAYPSVHLGSFEGLALPSSQSSHAGPELPPLRAMSPISPFPSLDADQRPSTLTIHIPRPLTPPLDELPTIRDSPSMARRRTVLPASPHAARVPSGRATDSSPTSPSPKRSLPHPPHPPPHHVHHAQTKSASSIPVVGGLADAGPYPSTPPNIGLGRPPRQDEICIECMMRDRDLADVHVQGPGVWRRGSDVTFEDLKRREQELLDNHADLQIGWRGFKWEDTLPPGFLGTRGGSLSEDAIKEVMRMVRNPLISLTKQYPSASAHRAKYMENYLYHQAILIRDIRAEASRLGRFPEPGEPHFRSDGSIVAGPRTSSVAWGREERSIRPSPSSPADLANLARPRPLVQFRPPDRKGKSFQQDWPPESGLRPFSFAVRAAQGSNDGHRNILGRWGGSVTSFFGGSQGGSGSMMDMQ
jgi:hypothetical protein